MLRGQRNRYAKGRRDGDKGAERRGGEGEEKGLASPAEEEGGGYGAFTLPCRRSHCLSEGLLDIPDAPRSAFQGRRAKTTQVSLERERESEGVSEYICK